MQEALQSSYKGDELGDRKKADKFCRHIKNDIAELGLNGDDANIVVWAVIEGLPLADVMNSQAFNANVCKNAVYKIKENRKK